MPTITISFKKELMIDNSPVEFDIYSFQVYKIAVAATLESKTCEVHGERPLVEKNVQDDQYVIAIITCCDNFHTEIKGILSEQNLS